MLKNQVRKKISKKKILKLSKKLIKSSPEKNISNNFNLRNLDRNKSNNQPIEIDSDINQQFLSPDSSLLEENVDTFSEKLTDCDVASSFLNLETSIASSERSLYCVCQKTNDQSLYIECDTCKEWYHPTCIYSGDNVALSFDEKQWQSVHLICSDQIPKFFDSKPIFFHDLSLNKNATSSAKPNNCANNGSSENQNTFTETAEFLPQDDGCINYNIIYPNLISFDNVGHAEEKAENESESSIDEISTSQSLENSYTLNQHISDRTLCELGKLNEAIDVKEKQRNSSVEYNNAFTLNVDEWKTMTANRSEHRFGNNAYVEIVVKKLTELYDFCVPCIRCHYLLSPRSVTKLTENSDRYLEGHVDVYCSHVSCCSCEVRGRVSFYSFVDKVEAVVALTGKRNHDRNCVRSRPVTGLQKQQLNENLSYEPASSVFRKLKAQLTENQNYHGSSVYAPSQAVLRNLKYKEKITERYSTNWIISLKIFNEKLRANNDFFIREIKADPPSVTMFSDVQLRLYTELCKKDIIYLDATGSIIKRSSNKKDFQLYTLLVRNPYKGSSSLPVATYLTNQHDASSIARFLQLFLLECKKLFKTKRTPLLLMVDGSFAIWNAVLREMCGETRTDYYKRCWRVATGSAEGKDLNKTFVHNCLSHSMKAAKIFVKKFYSGGCYKAAMFWIAKLFQCKNLNEIIEIMQSIITITNCYKTSPLIEHHFDKLKSDNDAISQTMESLITDAVDDDFEKDDNNIEHAFFQTVGEDKKQELNSPFCLYFRKRNLLFQKCNEFTKHALESDFFEHQNRYYNPSFCSRLIEVIVSRLGATSQLMLGDISRHKPCTSTKQNLKLYDQYSTKYKKVIDPNLQSVCEDNLTQGIIEQHFSLLKQTFLKNARFGRIDSFVEEYKKQIDVEKIKFFADIVHKGRATKQKNRNKIASLRKKCTSTPRKLKFKVPESKFRKRKLRNKGYFSSKKVCKTLDYLNKVIEIDCGDNISEKNLSDLSAVIAKNNKTVNDVTIVEPPRTNIKTKPFSHNSALNAKFVQTSDSLSENSLQLQTYLENNNKNIDNSFKFENADNFSKSSAASVNKVNNDSFIEILSGDSEPERCNVVKLAEHENSMVKVSFSEKRLKQPDFSSENFQYVEEFAQLIWQNEKLTEIHNTVLERNIPGCSRLSLTWLDLQTINPNTSDKLLEYLKYTCNRESGEGWLCTSVVDAFVSSVVDEANQACDLDSLKYGCLDCGTMENILNGRFPSQRVAEKNLTNKISQLRNELLFPVLWEKHFMLIWLSKTTGEFILCDSIKGNCQQNLKKCIDLHLRRYLNSIEPVVTMKVQKKCMVLQKDQSSCGVCVCIAVEAIIHNAVKELKNYSFSSSCHRMRLLYYFVVRSSSVNIQLLKYFQQTIGQMPIGLPNFGNTCWFNAVCQACANSVKSFSSSLKEGSTKLQQQSLFFALQCLIFGTGVEYETLSNIVSDVCAHIKFDKSIQQDAEEFYRNSFPCLLASLGISFEIEINQFSSCSNCKHKTRQQRCFQDDLLVPLYEHIESGANITSHINCFLAGLLLKECPSCKVKSFSCKNEIIFFPELLVLCVGRCSANKNKVVKFDSEMRLQGADENKLSSASYQLTSAITHTGKEINCGHYCCYNFNYNNVYGNCSTLIDDYNIQYVSNNIASKNVNQSAYLLFYKRVERDNPKTKISNKQSKKNPNHILKRRERCNLQSLDELLVLPERERRLVPYVPKYNVLLDASVADKKSWDRLFQDQDTLNFIEKTMISLLNMPITAQTKQHSQNFRHSLFLQRRSSLLKKYNYPFVPKNLNLYANLGFYIRSKLCDQKTNASFKLPFQTKADVECLAFYLKKSVLDPNSDLALYLCSDVDSCCTAYLELVLDYEAFTCFLMRRGNMSYGDASQEYSIWNSFKAA